MLNRPLGVIIDKTMKGEITMLRKIKGVLVGVAPLAVTVISGTAYAAAPTLDSIAAGVTLSTGAVITLFGIIIAGLAVMWGIRKMTKTTNKS